MTVVYRVYYAGEDYPNIKNEYTNFADAVVSAQRLLKPYHVAAVTIKKYDV